jgi:hypothetical protein
VNLSQLVRMRWGVRAVLTLGVAASVSANVLHARDDPISQAISAWPPLALLVTIELISRVPVHTRALARVRLVATALIAGIAAWVSYWHMAAVAARYGETGASPYLLPLSVDGLVVVASVCLVELAGRIRAGMPPASAEPAAALVAPSPTPPPTPATRQPAPATRNPDSNPDNMPVATSQRPVRAATAMRPPAAPSPGKGGRPLNASTLASITVLRQQEPAITQEQVAEQIGKGLRTVAGYWPHTTPPARANGRAPERVAP